MRMKSIHVENTTSMGRPSLFPTSRARIIEELEELTRLGRRLRTAMLRHALRAELAE